MTKKIDTNLPTLDELFEGSKPITKKMMAELGAANRKLFNDAKFNAEIAGGHFIGCVLTAIHGKHMSWSKLDRKCKFTRGTSKALFDALDESQFTLEQIFKISYAVGLKPKLTFDD